MKALFIVPFLFSGAVAVAQAPTNLGLKPELQPQKGRASAGSKVRAQKDLFELTDQGRGSNLPIQQKQVDKNQFSKGSEGVGGGNGIQDSSGQITPLDVIFAQENKVIDVQKSYSVGCKFFQEQVVIKLQRQFHLLPKISMPSFLV